ncbi:MAG: putative glycoside hydrolase, partial [Nanoarchaeota archaeon]
MDIPEKIILIIFIILITLFSIGLYYVLSYYDIKPIAISWFVKKEPVKENAIKEKPAIKPAVDNDIETTETISIQKLSNPPEIIKAVYITALSARSQQYQKYLDNLFETTEINAVVIDIKDYSGQTTISALDGFVQKLHNKGIYVIARIVIFQDPTLAKARPDLAIYDK